MSSTFADMQMERDVLSRIVFPKIRARFGPRLSLQEVDLRWGITAVMAANEGAADICLDEIEVCAPLVIGLVGSRVGWPRTALQSLRPARRDRLRAAASSDNPSMTEIELHYAGLLARDRKLPLPPIFFRTVAFTRGLHAQFDDGEEAEALRARMRAFGGASYDYDNRDSFEHQIEQCLVEMIESWLARQAPRLQARRSAIISRPTLNRAIARAASRRLPVLVTGQSGTGVSELARRWAEGGERSLILDGRKLSAQALPEALLQGAGFEAAGAAIGEEAELDARMSSALARLSAPVRIVLDHFDEAFAVAALSDLSMLPQKLPRKVELIVTAADRRLWVQAEALGWRRLEVLPFGAEEARRFCRDYLALFAKTLTEGQMQVLVSAPWANRVGAMTLALDELRRFGSLEALDARIAELAACKNDRALARTVIDGLASIEPDEWQGALGECLAAIAFSLRGLDETELRTAVGTAHSRGSLPPHIWSAFRIGLGRAFIERDGRFDIAEGAIAALLRDELPKTPDRMRRLGAAVMASLPSERRRAEEGPRIAFSIGGGHALAEFLAVPRNALSVVAAGQSFAEGWLSLLGREDARRVLRSWIEAARSFAMEAGAWPLGTLAARAGYAAEALELLAIDAAYQSTRPERDVMLAFLTAQRDALDRLKAEILAVLSAGETPPWLDMGIPVLIGAAAEGRAELSPRETGALLRSVRLQAGNANPMALAQAELAAGQIDFGLARWREAAGHFAEAERVARRAANVRMLTRSLERGAAVALERHKFRLARLKASECKSLAQAAALVELECLAYERLIEIERRRANWTKAYRLVEGYFARCRALGLGELRAQRMLDSLEA